MNKVTLKRDNGIWYTDMKLMEKEKCYSVFLESLKIQLEIISD